MSPQPTDPTAVELGDYLGIIRRRYVVVGVAVLICLALGVGYGLTRPDIYRSTSEIALPAPVAEQTPTQRTADVQTELAFMGSDLVAEQAAQAIGGVDDPRTLLDHLSVEAPPDARVLVIVYTASTAEAAQAGARAFADGYITVKETEQQSLIDQQVARYEERIATLEEGIAQQDEVLAQAEDGSTEFDSAERNRDDLRQQKSDLEAALADVEAQPVDGGTIITPARLPRQPKAKGLGRTVAAALAAGLLLGLAAAFVMDRLDTRVRGAADLQASLGVRSLGSVPVFPERNRHPSTALVTVHAPGGSEADAFRRLRTSVLLAVRESGARTLAITSSVADEGKSTMAANLAVAMAQGGHRVLLVSADLRRKGIDELFELPRAPGLSDLLLAQATLDEVERSVGNLKVITGGSPVDNPTDLLGSEKMADAVEALAHGFDLVLFDTPPVLAVADALVLAPRLDTTLLVVSLSQASTAEVAEATTELTLAGASVLGAVLNNDADSSRRSASAAKYGVNHA
ncbi:MAG TPA: polysaccharide biosynthesis tyrosine autokinase [Iamia sp.]